MKLAHKVDALWQQTQTLQICLRLVDRQENTETVIQTLEATNKLLAQQLKKCLGAAKETKMSP